MKRGRALPGRMGGGCWGPWAGERGGQPGQAPPPPPGHRLRGAPREPPAAAADGRWQQTAGNGRARRRRHRGDGSAGGCPRFTSFYFIFLNKEAGGRCQEGSQAGSSADPRPPHQDTHTPGVHRGFSVIPLRTGLKWLKRPARTEVRGFHKWLPTQDVEESA